jgi:peptidoglycan/xylan/chitin deacetylase (PgdA/CDA1 family)
VAVEVEALDVRLGHLGRQLLAEPLHHSGLLDRYRERTFRSCGAILMYHRTIEPAVSAPPSEPGMYVTRRSFARHLEMLVRRYTLVTMDEFGDWLAGRVRFERPPCALTFDDGWADNYDVAFPLLKLFRVPATIFLITGSIGGPGMLAWEQIEEMESAGVSFGSHTVTHALLGQCSRDQARFELEESKRALDGRLKRPSGWFCFPKGSHNKEACDLVREYYSGAVTTVPGWVAKGDDPSSLRRIGIHEDMTATAGLLSWRLAQLR